MYILIPYLSYIIHSIICRILNYTYNTGIPKINLFNKQQFIDKVDKQLKRLGVEYIDILYFASPSRALRIPGKSVIYYV